MVGRGGHDTTTTRYTRRGLEASKLYPLEASRYIIGHNLTSDGAADGGADGAADGGADGAARWGHRQVLYNCVYKLYIILYINLM